MRRKLLYLLALSLICGVGYVSAGPPIPIGGNQHIGDVTILDGVVAAGGNVVLMESSDIGNANRTTDFSDTDPRLRVYSSDEAQANDFIDIYHNQAGAIIATPGSISMNPTTGVVLINSGATSMIQLNGSLTLDQMAFSVHDEIGNQLIITNADNASKDHDHALQTNPTLYVHSDTDPDTANDEWASITHDVTNGVFGLGSGAYVFPDGVIATGAGTVTCASDVCTDVLVSRLYVTTEVAGAADVLTIPDAVVTGTERIVCLSVDGGDDLSVTPTNFNGGALITLGTAGECVTLGFDGTNWYVESTNGGVIS